MTATPGLLLFLCAAAFLAGLVDAIAGGGGLVTVPALLAAGLPPPLALGTNKGQAVFGALTSAASFWGRRALDRERAALGFAAGFAGSWLGARAVLAVPARPLRVVVIVLLLVAVSIVLLRRKVQPHPRHWKPGQARAALVAIALVLGAYDGFFGPGTGSMLVVAFATVFGDALTRASGNAKIVNLASNLAAFALFAWHGTVLWRLSLPMAAANAAGAAAGAHLAVRNGDRLVGGVVVVVVLAVVVKLAVDLVR
ncbi:MAG TPA: TSUP family transporter [Polyangia bacterium]|nr:TSUP family transporter [Polyangia bacterium]